jgi:hypothetical protein
MRDLVSRFPITDVDAGPVWWLWIVGGLTLWLGAGAALGLLIGRGIRFADRPSAAHAAGPRGDHPEALATLPARAAHRRALPLPPVGIALAATAVALESAGFVLRLTGASGPTAELWSMDAPFALPRLYVSLLFAAAASAAVMAAGRMPGRRSWWLVVALVGGGIAAVKAGGTVHADAVGALTDAVGQGGTVLLSVLAAAAVVGVVWSFTRSERRDRRRVLGSLGFYAFASVGLSALSAAVPAAWYTTATFVEESGEALAAVAFLMAVLAGVAPRLVLPAGWPLRRSADAHTLEIPEQVTGATAVGDVR